MAIVHDVMPAYELFQPTDVESAITLLREHGDGARILGGGMDTWDWLKDRNKRITALVDLGGIPGLQDIKVTADGIEIGAMVPLSVVARNADVVNSYTVLARAAGRVASPQIRNQGTIGGNVNQDVRCWYYRSGWPCYRAGGNICYANTPQSLNREHAILDANRCVAVSPSDTAPALVALDAKMIVQTRRGVREINAADYFLGPATDIRRTTVLKHGEVLTSIRIPKTWSGAQFYFEKVADRKSWDFPLVNVASAIRMEGGSIADARIVVGAVAARPMRLRKVEDAIRGKAADEATAAVAGELAVRGAVPLRLNGYKVPLMRNLVKRAIRGQEA
ncbi:MAG: xanthine dehydrogenase family protein subunit M [Gemmatimonadota bacterium]|jgi:xanthine dehydrogenase YagS FAD-binding subunit|nr:xanthine dehydrogenase family protein subunit M [Gemmatimonadota bacterium]